MYVPGALYLVSQARAWYTKTFKMAYTVDDLAYRHHQKGKVHLCAYKRDAPNKECLGQKTNMRL